MPRRARVIETNRLRRECVRLAKHGLEHRVKRDQLVGGARSRRTPQREGIYVAGSVGPLGITAEQAKAPGHRRHAVFP